MNLADFLNLETPETYDFVEETAKEGYREIEDVFEKFFLYKVVLTGNDATMTHAPLLHDEDSLDKFVKRSRKLSLQDPDSASELLQEIYKRLWPDLEKQPFMLQAGGKIASDTMTSVQASLNEAMKAFAADEDMVKIYKKGKIYYSQKGAIALAANEDKTHFCEKLKKKYPTLEQFIALFHTIGNYCPVPAKFNSARSGAYANYDYWDLTLMKIWEWYHSTGSEGERDALIRDDLLHGSGSASNCILWLKMFGDGESGWRNFVNTLFMQDYVDVDKDYKPTPLWEGHSWESITLPVDQCEEFFAEVASRIMARSKRMVEALRNSKEEN